MADGRKNNGGHSTRGKAGRPPKSDEIKMIEQMDAIAAPEKAWRMLWERAEDGDTPALKAWIEYRHGKPKQSLDATLSIDLGEVFPEDA